MLRYCIVSIINGFLFGTLDAVINANPFARKLFECYKPVARTTVNAPAGVVIDLVYGFAMGFIFLTLYSSLPGNSGLLKGISFACMVWFFRVVMSVVTNWMIFTVPVSALLYTAAAGLIEMLIIGMVYGAFLKPV